MGCISKTHLCVETSEQNYQRNHCKGIRIHIHRHATGESILSQVDACIHGKTHKKANGDELKYSCRKIQAIITDDNDFL